MTGSGRTLDPREREDLIGRAGRRLFGPVPKVEFIPPEGSTETEPPYDTPEIRYWEVLDSRRLRRHRSKLAALRDPGTRSRLRGALRAVTQSAPRRLGLPLVANCALVVGSPVGIFLLSDGGTLTGASRLGLIAFLIAWAFTSVLFFFRLWGSSRAGSLGSDLSHDEEDVLLSLTGLAGALGWALLFLMSLQISMAIIAALGLGQV